MRRRKRPKRNNNNKETENEEEVCVEANRRNETIYQFHICTGVENEYDYEIPIGIGWNLFLFVDSFSTSFLYSFARSSTLLVCAYTKSQPICLIQNCVEQILFLCCRSFMLDIHHNKHLCTVNSEHTWALYNGGEQCTSPSGWERSRLSIYALYWISFFLLIYSHIHSVVQSFGSRFYFHHFFFRFHLHHRMVI